MLVVLNVPPGRPIRVAAASPRDQSVLIVVFLRDRGLSLNNSLSMSAPMIGFGILGYVPCARAVTSRTAAGWPSCSAACSSKPAAWPIIWFCTPWFFLKKPDRRGVYGLACVVTLAPRWLRHCDAKSCRIPRP